MSVQEEGKKEKGEKISNGWIFFFLSFLFALSFFVSSSSFFSIFNTFPAITIAENWYFPWGPRGRRRRRKKITIKNKKKKKEEKKYN